MEKFYVTRLHRSCKQYLDKCKFFKTLRSDSFTGDAMVFNTKEEALEVIHHVKERLREYEIDFSEDDKYYYVKQVVKNVWKETK